jgi:hypothetical protein
MAAFRPGGSSARGDNGTVPADFMGQRVSELTKLQVKPSMLVNLQQPHRPDQRDPRSVRGSADETTGDAEIEQLRKSGVV